MAREFVLDVGAAGFAVLVVESFNADCEVLATAADVPVDVVLTVVLRESIIVALVVEFGVPIVPSRKTPLMMISLPIRCKMIF